VTAEELIERLGLEPHPEGGHYAQTWRGAPREGRDGASAIHFLLRAGERSHWHRVDADEIWSWHAGAPLQLSIADDDEVRALILGGDVTAGERPHAVVPAHAWQAAESLGEWTLVSCFVVPGFEFDGFELAPPGWSPGSPVV
jgi:predicted cupin superfamily sugar epimerase